MTQILCQAALLLLLFSPCPQAAALLAAVQLEAHEEAEVKRIKSAIIEAQAAAPAADAACGDLDDSCQARLLHAAPADVAALKEELVRIAEVRAAWQELAVAAAERQACGVELQLQPPAASEVASKAAALPGSPSSASSQSRRGSARLARQGSTMSVASSASSRPKQSRGASRAAKEAAA